MNIEESLIELKNYIKDKTNPYFDNYGFATVRAKQIQAIETLLKAYEKEKETVDKINKLNIPVDTLIAEFERLEDLEDDLTTVYLNGVYDGEKKVEDKIKAKIEELDYKMIAHQDVREAVRQVLQSLLEKE